jgi:hypothetical protein
VFPASQRAALANGTHGAAKAQLAAANPKRRKMAADHIDHRQSAVRLVPCEKTDDGNIQIKLL